MSILTANDGGEERRRESEPEDDCPNGLAKPAPRALHGAGYTRLKQLTAVKERDLLALHGMGPKAMGVLREALRARGLSFADSEKG